MTRENLPTRSSAQLDSVVDCHVHLSRPVSYDQLIDTMEGAGLDHVCLIGPFLSTEGWTIASGAGLERANDELLDLAGMDPERLWALVTVDPRESQAARQIERYAGHPATRGVKLIPAGWRPDQPVARAVYEACGESALPILFHSGIFIGSRHSDACRPALFEAVRDVPGLKVVLAHLGWPWVDEAIAVALMDPLAGRSPQFFLDTSPGTPAIYRREALRKAFEVLGPNLLIFGSDFFLPVDPAKIADQVERDMKSFLDLGADGLDLGRIFGGNAHAVFGATIPLPTPVEVQVV